MFKDFKKFIMRGSLLDLAIGFTVGAAFTTVVKSLVNDMIMPLVGLVVGRVDFEDFFLVLDVGEGTRPYHTIEQAQAAGAVTLNYGVFINNCVALALVGVVMFLIIRSFNRVRDELQDDDGNNDHEPEQPDDKKCIYCRSTIPFRATRCAFCTSELPRKETLKTQATGTPIN